MMSQRLEAATSRTSVGQLMRRRLSSVKDEAEATWCPISWFHIRPDHSLLSPYSEFQEAVRKYPSVLVDDYDRYVGYSATAGINVGQDNYFDNETVLK